MKFAKSTIPRYNKLKGGRWYCKLKVSLKFEKVHHIKTQKTKNKKTRVDVRVADLQCARNLQKSTLQRYRNSRVDVGITNLECELKFAASTIQRDKNWRVDVGVTNLQCNSKFAKSTIQRYTDSRVDVGLTNLQCPWNFLSAIRRYNISKVKDYHKKYKKQGWTLALQTYTVFEICEVYHTNNFKNNQGWTLALQTYSVLEICKVYHTQLQKFNALHTYSVTEKSKVYHAQIQQIQGSTSTTPQRHTKSRVEIGVTNLQCLQCPGHMQSLR